MQETQLAPEIRTVAPAARLVGELAMPPDKSLSHRAALFAGLARGTSRIKHFLRGEDCLNTVACIQAMGVQATWDENGDLLVVGAGLEGLKEPGDVLYAGNSGTTMRLLAGVLAGAPFFATITGDASLRGRPMRRVVDPLTAMGATIWGRQDARFAPLSFRGGAVKPLAYTSPVASAQVKSAVLLAGLFADGETSVTEPARSRDHTERMLRAMGAQVRVNGTTAGVLGRPTLSAIDFRVPGDISSAAFWLVAGTVVPGSELLLRGVGVNETRTGILDVLLQMGADITREQEREEAGEPVCDLRVRSATLTGTRIAGDLIPRLVDEIPILAVAAGCAQGETVIADAQELRVKESDRIASIVREFGPLGLEADEQPDGLTIRGGAAWKAGRGESGGDHRIAMCLAIIGLLADGQVEVRDTACTRTSYPDFWAHLAQVVAEGGAK